MKIKEIIKNRYFKIISIILFILAILFIPFYRKTNLISIIDNRIKYLTLSEERQAVYDKMKIEYLNIKSRVTGTAPFNVGDGSNSLGVDVSDSDDYVRTFDLMKYTVEVGISANTAHDGVDGTSVFEGGVIKVRAKLPNQGSPTLMRWEQDVWMKNVEYSNDKTEIYAEYHVPSGVSVTNANQNLTFTVKVDGYKKEVTNEMAPEFEIWMEGNKPDDNTSGADSLSEKDTRNIIISGDYSFDFSINKGNLNNYSVLNDIEGHYINYSILAKLYQPYDNISGMKGLLYPTGKINITLEGNYKYFYSASEGGWITINDPNNLLNGTQLIAYTSNGVSKTGFYPSSMYYMNAGVGGNRSVGTVLNSVYSSGTVEANLNNNVMQVSFDGYQFDGNYPTKNLNSGSSFSEREGVFGSANVEVFVPYCNPENRSSVENQITFEIQKVSIENEYNLGENEEYHDGINNDSAVINLTEKLSISNIVSPLRARTKNSVSTYLSSAFNSEDASSLLGDSFIIETWSRASDGPYYGGADNLISWNSSFFELQKYTYRTVLDPESMYDTLIRNELGFDTIPVESVNAFYGIYKDNPEGGLTTNSLANAAKYEDFDWYSTYAEASQHGTVTSFYSEDYDNIGNANRRTYRLKFKTKNNSENIGQVGIFRYRNRFFGDLEKADVYYYRGQTSYNSTNAFLPTVYDTDGNITRVGAPEALGESILILGAKTGINITSTDKDSSNNTKTAYDVQDGEINLKITPTFTDNQTATDNDLYYDSIIVKAFLPNGLSYHSGSANKDPKSVSVHADGTTTIEWEYNHWQINHEAPEYPEINFSADISASLENNASLNIKSTIFSERDLRDEKSFRTSEYGVVISNLAGSKALKTIDKAVVEKDESFNVTSTLGNNSDEILDNVKTIEILPRNHDDNGSIFSGNYTVKVKSLISGQKIFYATGNISQIGLTEDRYGKITISDVDLENDNRWIEVGVGDIIPNNATAVATLLGQLSAHAEDSFVMEVIPSGNKGADIYGFSLNMTSDNLQAAIKTNTVVSTVVSRKISGKFFSDKNRNGQYDEADTLFANRTVKLLNNSGNVIMTMQTNSNGEYNFINLDKANYYIEFVIPNNYETIAKGDYSKTNSNGKTDIIDSLNVVPSNAILEASNIDCGVQKKAAVINVSYVEYNNITNVFDSTSFSKYYGDTYNIDNDYLPNIPDNYELKEKTSNYTGTIGSDEINVIYYYQKKDSQLTTSIEKTGTDKITSKTGEVNYKVSYEALISDYIGNGIITIVDTLPYAIDITTSQLDGGIYDASNLTITWTENVATTSIEEKRIVVEKNIKLYYSGVEPTDREMVNTVQGTIVLDDKERSVSDTYDTSIEIKGKIIVHYIEVNENDEEVGELTNSIENFGLIGDEYVVENKEFEGYEIFKKPEESEFSYTEEEQEVKYLYKKKKVNVETIVHGIGGNIQGNEIVYYGDNSTKGKIIIEADDGYKIESIKINGQIIEVRGIQTRMIIDNFENMKEDKLIEVTFKKKEPITNPLTGTNSIRLLIMCAIFASLVLINDKRRIINITK